MLKFVNNVFNSQNSIKCQLCVYPYTLTVYLNCIVVFKLFPKIIFDQIKLDLLFYFDDSNIVIALHIHYHSQSF